MGEATGKTQSTAFLIQWLVIDVQLGNTASVMSMLPSTRDWTEVGFLPTLPSYLFSLLQSILSKLHHFCIVVRAVYFVLCFRFCLRIVL